CAVAITASASPRRRGGAAVARCPTAAVVTAPPPVWRAVADKMTPLFRRFFEDHEDQKPAYPERTVASVSASALLPHHLGAAGTACEHLVEQREEALPFGLVES